MDILKFLEMFLILIGLHFIADFGLQNDFQAKLKGNNNYIMLAHCMIWGTIISSGLIYFDMFEIWKFVFLVLFHFLIDKKKCNKKDKSKALTDDLYIDQLFHLLQIIFVIIII